MTSDAGVPGAPRFDVVLRGYDRRQVDEHVDRLQRVLARMRADLEVARSQPMPAVSPGPRPRPTPRPRPGGPADGPDTIGTFTDRMETILQSAEEEAAEIRRNAHLAARAETDGVRAQVADLIRQRDAVLAELTRMRSQLEGLLAAPTAQMPAHEAGRPAWRGDAGRPAPYGRPDPGPWSADPDPRAGADPLRRSAPVPSTGLQAPAGAQPATAPDSPAGPKPGPVGSGPGDSAAGAQGPSSAPAPSTAAPSTAGPAAGGGRTGSPVPSPPAPTSSSAPSAKPARADASGSTADRSPSAPSPSGSSSPGPSPAPPRSGSAPSTATPSKASPSTVTPSSSADVDRTPGASSGGSRSGSAPSASTTILPTGVTPPDRRTAASRSASGHGAASGSTEAAKDTPAARPEREAGKAAHRLPTGAYPAVGEGSSMRPPGDPEPEPADLFRPVSRGASADAQTSAVPRGGADGPEQGSTASAAESTTKVGSVRPEEPTVLSPQPGAAGKDHGDGRNGTPRPTSPSRSA